MRDEFSKKVKDTLARRVAYLCSNPSCRKRTCGPAEDENKFCSIGEAAHITAASKGGPRYDYSLTPEERSSINNGIWLCKNCARLIDIDEEAYPVDLLRNWKDEAERNASESLGQRHEDMIENTRYQDIEMNCKNAIDCLCKEVIVSGPFKRKIVLIPSKYCSYIDDGQSVVIIYDGNQSLLNEFRYVSDKGFLKKLNNTSTVPIYFLEEELYRYLLKQ